MSLLLAITGWVGAGSLLLAYALVSTKHVEGNGLVFQLLNLAGGTGLAINSGAHRAWPSVTLNLVWIVVGLGTLARMRNAQRQPR
jgi:hypothetical protein